MYNEQFKREYLEQYNKDRFVSSPIDKTFEELENIETEFNKDVSLFTKEELVEAVKRKEFQSTVAARNYISYIRRYTNYAIDHGYAKENHCNDITTEDILNNLGDFRHQTGLFTLEDMRTIQGKLLNATDKAILECLFNGISGDYLEDLVSICSDQLDKEKKILHLKSRKDVKITNELCDYLEQAFEETELISYQSTDRVSHWCGKGLLIKEAVNTHKDQTLIRKYRRVIRKVQVWRDYLGLINFTVGTILTSGLYDMLKRESEENCMLLADFLKTKRGKEIAEQWNYYSDKYAYIIIEKLKTYVEI